MPSLIEGNDRQTVKRAVPKASNKIHAVAVAKLYVAHPDKNRWTFTGLQGAIVLADDLVGNTFWLKLVDISPANRGVIWDQEIYDTFSYNQDRVFFHTFELEQCLAGLSFADDKEAKQFKKKMDEREKSAHKDTSRKPFNIAAASYAAVESHGTPNYESVPVGEKSHSRLGGFGNFLHGRGHRSSSQQQQGPMQSIIPPREVTINTNTSTRGSAHKPSALTNIDSKLLDELLALGLTEDQLRDNADFIKMYVDQRKSTTDAQERRQKVAPPPPPSPPQSLTPQDTGGGVRRIQPPAPPPARRTTVRSDGGRPPSPDSAAEDESSSRALVRAPSPAPAPSRPRFHLPPPIADAGKFAADDRPAPSSPARARTGSAAAHPGPPPPPRAGRPAPDEDERPSPTSARSVPPPGRFAVPPVFQGDRKGPPTPSRGTPSRGSVPPPPPARGGVPLPPPARGTGPPPALPPKGSGGPPLPPARDTRSVPLPPPLPIAARNSGGPLPPPLPPMGGAPPPPPLPPPGMGGPPAPPPPPGMSVPPALPNVETGGRGNLLADIRGGARLKKVSDTEKRDRSQAVVPGAAAASTPAPASAGGSTPGADAGGLAGALASALAARKSKVSASDDEDDHDEW